MGRGVRKLYDLSLIGEDKDISLLPNGQREETSWIEGKIGGLGFSGTNE